MVNNEEILKMNPKKNIEIKKALMKDGIFEKASYTPYIGDGYEDAKEKILFIGDCKLPTNSKFIEDSEKNYFPQINYCTQIIHYCKLIKKMNEVEDIKAIKETLTAPKNKRLTMDSIRTLKKYAQKNPLNYKNFAYYNFFYNQFDNVTIPNQGLSSKSDKLKQYQSTFLSVVKTLNPNKIVIENSVLKDKIIGRSRDLSFFKENKISYEIANVDNASAIDNYYEKLSWNNSDLEIEFLATVEAEHEDVYSFLKILNKIPLNKIDKLKNNEKLELLNLIQFLHRVSTTNVNRLHYDEILKLFQCLYKFFFKKNLKKFNIEKNKKGAFSLLKKFIEEYFDIYVEKKISTRKIDKFFKENYFENLNNLEFQNELQKLIEELDLITGGLEKKSLMCNHCVTTLKSITDNCKKNNKTVSGAFIQFLLKSFVREYILNSKEIEPFVFQYMTLLLKFLYIRDVQKRRKCSKNKNDKDFHKFIKNIEDEEFRKRIQLLIKKYPEFMAECMGREYNDDYLAKISNEEMRDFVLLEKRMLLKHIDELNDQELKISVQILIGILFVKLSKLDYDKINSLLNEVKKEFSDIASNKRDFTEKTKVSVNAYSLFMCMKRMRTAQHHTEKQSNQNIERMLEILERDDFYIEKRLIPSTLKYISDSFPKDSIPYIDETEISSDDINEYLNAPIKNKVSASGIDNKLTTAYKYFESNSHRRIQKYAQIMIKRIFESRDTPIRLLIGEKIYKEFKEEGKIIKNWTPK